MGFPGPHVYKAKADGMGLADHSTFTGRIAYEQAPGHLALGDVAVGPKMSATEGSGKLLNYMAMGLPVVAFDTPVSREYLAGHGSYAAPGDAGQLAERVLELVADRDGAARAGRRLRERAEASFDWLAAGRRLIGVYDALGVRAPARAVPGETR